MKEPESASHRFFFISYLGAGLTALTLIVLVATPDSEGWGAMFFTVLAAPLLGGAMAVLAIIPSAVVYRRRGERRAKNSLIISSTTVAILGLAWFMVVCTRGLPIF